MNFLRNMMGGHQRPLVEAPATPQDNTLGLMHLRKLFADFRHPVPNMGQKELEDKLYNMLPLFCKVFGSAPSTDMTEKFGDILQFCSQVSRLMVSEIRRRASNQSTDAASCAIVKFLEIESTEESSNGWMLLSAINLLSTGADSLIDCMTAASLPSTLVKCLYLFFDLPHVDHADRLDPGCEFTPKERRVLLQKVFVQVLVRLCSHVSPAEELARKDDLTLLFSAITSWCPPHNIPWRKSAAEVLMTLSRHGLTPNVVQYIHSKGCVALCIDNMQRVQELSPIELVEMFVTVFCFLKDSSEVSQLLLDDFRSCQGYVFLSDFLLRMESDDHEESIQALRNLVLLVGSLTTCGFIELKPSTTTSGSLFQMPGFTVPQPTGKGVSVRNLQAFHVLQTVFLKGTSTHQCSTILDVISSIYHQDNANYFILEAQCTLSQFAERIHQKDPEVQNKFFELLEFIVFNLNYVPCKELISVSILIKTNLSVQCSQMCLRTLLKILHYHAVYKDVFREVGLLEVMVTCLHRYAALLKEPERQDSGNDESGDYYDDDLYDAEAPVASVDASEIPQPEQEMGFLVMEALAVLLNSNSQNAGVFRECGGARCAHNMVPFPQCRHQALNIVQQLVLSNGGEDDMGTLLGLMHTAPTTALELKTHILNSLLNVLRESHRTRIVFRKVGGFVYVMSVLVSMEGCLADPPKAPWDTAKRRDIITLLKTVFSTLTVAMRYEPANAKFFATEVRYASLTEAVRLLGCFSGTQDIGPVPPHLEPREETILAELFCNLKESRLKNEFPRSLVSACMMLRYLYDMALDNFDKPVTDGRQLDYVSPSMKRISSVLETSTDPHEPSPPPSSLVKRNSTGSVSLTLVPPTPEPSIVHAGAVVSMLHLVPSIDCADPQLSLDLQAHTCEVLKSLVRSERNQQVMCEAGLPHELLSHANLTLADEAHPLHPPIQYMFERLAAQCLTPKDLRDFLRLADPLCCAAEEEMDASLLSDQPPFPSANIVEHRPGLDINKKLRTNGGAVPLTRVKCLVSMTTPRDVRLHGAAITPAFVEFDLSAEGFGCLHLASIAPQGPPTPSVVGAGMIGGSDPGVVGGIGSGERLFPPQSGMTFSSWICVDKFSAASCDPHPVRLLTIVRNIAGREDNLICLSVYLAPRDRALFVSTQERHMPLSVSAESEMEPLLNNTNVRFWCPELTQEGQWRHLVLLFNKAGIMKNSSVSLFVDGQHINTQKLHYISPNLGSGGTASPNAATSVFAYLGTPPALRRPSRLVWRQGPCHLLEDIVSTAAVLFNYQLGPNYVGSFQAPIGDKNEVAPPVISEDKIMFGVHAHAMSLMTIAKIRKVYNKVDAKSIAKQLGTSAHENATPIRILHNSAGHLSGPARSFGAILMGYLGVRTFCPRPVAKVVLNVGGTSALLGLIAMATDVEGLYAAVKALVCVVRSNKVSQREMDRTRGYQTLAMLFTKKRQLLNSHILHLTFSLVGTVDSGRESTVIPNSDAFQDLLCNLEVWRDAPGELHRSLYEHFIELLTESSEQRSNLKLLQEFGMVSKLLHVLRDPGLSHQTVQIIARILIKLLSNCHEPSLLRYGQFLVSTLPAYNISEKSVHLEENEDTLETATQNYHTGNMDSIDGENISILIHNIQLRNHLILILFKRLSAPPCTNGVNTLMVEEIQRVLGYDWLLLFMQAGLHPSTIILAMRMLVLMLALPAALNRFREGMSGGGWLDETECVLQNRIGMVLGFSLNTTGGRHINREINTDVCHLPGFMALQWLLPKHADIPTLYFLQMALLMGQPIKSLPAQKQFDLDSVWTFIFGVPASQPPGAKPRRNAKSEMCPEAAIVILAMIRAMLNQSQAWEKESTPEWLQEYPVTLMQFFHFLYHNQPEFVPLCMSGDFLCALAATLFPYRFITDSSSELSSPVEDFKPFPGSDSMVFVKMQDNVNVPHRRRPDDPMMILISNTRGNINPALSNHPARKFVMDFMKTVVVDSLSLPQSSKTAPAIDLLLEAAPDHATRTQRREFQTEILKNLMDHLLAADALLGDQAALPIASGGSYAHMANNIFYFTNRVVDKLWQGSYLRESKEVFDFVSKLIQQAKRKASGISLDGIYKGLNRVILYQLSRPMFSVADQTSVLDALHKLTSNRGLVFGPGNYDQEFIGCLCYCLLQLTTEDPCAVSGSVHGGTYGNSEPPMMRQTTWHMDPDCESDPEDNLNRSADSSGNAEGFQLVANAARRVWEELYVCKKPTIEEIFKVTLLSGEMSSSPRISTPNLVAVRPQIMEVASRLWVTYYENERKCSYSHTERIQSQLQSVITSAGSKSIGKLQKVGHGVLRLATRKTKKDVAIKASPASIQDTNAWTLTHVSIVKDLVEFQYKQQQKSRDHMEKYLLEEWTQTETELMRERGLWGPLVGSDLDKWMLDMTEGPHRMRKKIIRNDMFYIHYPYKEPDPLKPTKYKMAISLDSKKHFERYRSRSLVGDEAVPLQREDSEIENRDNGTDDYPEEMPMNFPCMLPRLPSGRFNSTQEDDPDLDLSVNSDDRGEDTQGEAAGNDDDTEKTDNQKLLRLLEEGEKISHMFRCARIQGLDTMEGLLLFGKEHFYVVDGFTLLKTKEIADIDAIPADMHEPIIPKTSKGTTGQKRMCSKFAYEDIREVHKRRYLLQPIAIEVFSADGRNYLLAFPRKIRNKIYAKYLQLATSLKDNAHESVSGQKQSAKVEPGTGLISSLIGEKSVTQRWERGEISNFEYLMCLNTLAGRSYNDLMQYPVFPWIVQDYDSEELDLANPATFRDLSKPMGAQTPDRLKQFKRRYQDWDDPQGETPPYHYGTHYSSAMIVASYLVRMEPFTQHFLRLQGGHFDLADRMFHSVRECWLSASKHNMADVKELIPEFFYLSDFLLNSNNFDLGAKQSGVQLYDVQLPRWAKNNPREFIRAHREALECDYVSAHIHEWIDLIFGYKQQGPLAADTTNVFHHLFYEGNVDIYTIDDPLKKNATIGFINNFGQIPKQLFKKAHPQKKLSLRSMDMLSMGPLVNASADRLFFHHLDNLKPTMVPIKELKGVVGQIIHVDKNVLAVEQNKVLVPPAYNKYLAWGFADLSIRIGNYDSDKATHVFENLDNGEIMCAGCPNPKCIITAGTSTVVSVWEYGKGKDKRALCLKQSLYGHTEPVTCLAASAAYNIILSGSRDRTCIIWDLSRLIFVRQLRGHSAPVAAVCINDLTGDMATCAGTFLHVWTVNGEEIATINTATSRNQQILCVASSQMMEWDVRNVIMTGNSDGVVRMWSVEFVEVPDENYQKPKEQQLTKPEPPPRPPAPRTSPQPILNRQCPDPERSAVDRLRDFNDPDLLAAKEVELGSSAESDGTPMDHYHQKHTPLPRGPVDDLCDFRVSEPDLISFDENDDMPIMVRGCDVDTAVDVLSEVDGGGGSKPMMYGENGGGGGASVAHHQHQQHRQQRDPNSPSSDFVFVTDNEVKDAMKSHAEVVQKFSPHSPRRLLRGLREGFKWQRQLVFRSKLTMHTAFERKDNKDPAAVTAIAVSKDHKTVYVGDAKGRIYSWSVTDQPGRVVADHWMKDEGVENCTACSVKFSFSERRHHCRNCGQLFCSKCSRFETEIRRLRIMKPVRVCQACHTALRAQQAAEAKNSRNAVNT